MRKVLGLVIFISIFGCKSDTETQILELSKKSQEFALNEKFEEAINALNEIENIYQNQILPPLYKKDKTINLSTNVFYLLKECCILFKVQHSFNIYFFIYQIKNMALP